mmetsp:Transcript_271/g.745  ORF Transcript_271/g.745 Transcript_271/m.745 type:complete len:209 (+) Transcript_271:539-1165(+)
MQSGRGQGRQAEVRIITSARRFSKSAPSPSVPCGAGSADRASALRESSRSVCSTFGSWTPLPGLGRPSAQVPSRVTVCVSALRSSSASASSSFCISVPSSALPMLSISCSMLAASSPTNGSSLSPSAAAAESSLAGDPPSPPPPSPAEHTTGVSLNGSKSFSASSSSASRSGSSDILSRRRPSSGRRSRFRSSGRLRRGSSGPRLLGR